MMHTTTVQRSHNTRLIGRLICSILCIFFSFFCFLSYANPQGGEVVSGDITITQPSSTETVITQTSNEGIINWQSFNIAEGEHTHFDQPSTSSITLNRIMGSDLSRIMGRLTAVGKIMLVNQAGIFFGPNAVVDVAGIIATTSDIRDSDFLKGTYTFVQNGDAASSIINQGRIAVADEGIAMLMAPGVENAGIISANLGKVVLASVAPGSAYTVDLYGDDLIHFLTRMELVTPPQDQNGQPMDSAIKNTGEIHVAGGKILLTAKAAKDVVHSVINTSGIIEANTVSVRNGEIFLDAGDNGTLSISGTISARGNQTGESGGTVKITGGDIKVAENAPATADVSGMAGGGEIFLGGEVMGQGELPKASNVYVGPQASLLANALEEGTGGTVVVWSEGNTVFYGSAEAIGAGMGSGGLIETSGDFVDITGASIHAGAGGLQLIDPIGPLDISDYIASITSALEHGSDYTLQSTGATGDININQAVNITGINSGNVRLTLLADRNINIDNAITLTGSSEAELWAQATGNINFNTSDTSTTSGTQRYYGNVLLLDDVNLSAGKYLAFGNTINGAHNLTGYATEELSFGDIGTSTPVLSVDFESASLRPHDTTTVTTVGSQTYNGPMLSGNTLTLNTTGTGDIAFLSTLDSNGDSVGEISVTTTNGNVIFWDALGSRYPLDNLYVSTTGGSTTLRDVSTWTGQVYAAGPVLLADTNTTLSNLYSGDILFDSTIDGSVNFILNNTGGGDIRFNDSIGSTTPLLSLDITNDGTIQIGGNVTTTGTQSYDSGATEFIVFYPNSVIDNTLTSTSAGGNINFASKVIAPVDGPGSNNIIIHTDDGTVTFQQSLTDTNNLTISASGDITFIDDIGTISDPLHAVDLTSTSGDISMVDVFTQGSQTYDGGDISFGTLQDTTGALSITGENATGDVDVGSFRLGTSAGATLTGSVAGQSGQAAADAITLFGGQPSDYGTHFFDSIDLYKPTAEPPSPLTPQEKEIPDYGDESNTVVETTEGQSTGAEVEVSDTTTTDSEQSTSSLSDPTFNLEYGKNMLSQNKPQIAMFAFNRVLIDDPDSFEARVALIKSYLRLGMRREALSELTVLRQHIRSLPALQAIDAVIKKILQ